MRMRLKFKTIRNGIIANYFGIMYLCRLAISVYRFLYMLDQKKLHNEMR